MGGPQQQHWQIDRKIPLALIVTILLQTFGVVYWGATLQADARNTERRVSALENANFGDRLARIEAQMVTQNQLLADIKSDLRKK